MSMKINVPDSWNEVSVGKFQEISSLDNKSKDYALNVVSFLIEQDPEIVRKYDSQSISKVIRHLEWAMKSPEENAYNTCIEIEGVEYKLIENLNGFTGGEWWDMEEYLANYDNNLHYIFAMLYRPDNSTYNAEECKKRGELFKEKAMIGQLYGSLVFFSNVAKESTLTIPASLINHLKKKMEKPKKNTAKG